MIKAKIIYFSFILIFFLFTCNTGDQSQNTENEYLAEIMKWKENRLKKLKSPNGWLNLAGLYWLEEGVNDFGSNSENKIIFPDSAPEFIGAIIKIRDQLSISVNDSIDVFVNDSLIKEHGILTDADGNPTLFSSGRYNWHIIKREDKYALRLRDMESPLINMFNKIPSFPVSEKWKVEAFFKKFDSPIPLFITDITGSESERMIYGKLTFRLFDKDYELLPLGDGITDDLFVMFADGTSALETYGGGRYLYVDKPDINGKTTIDFNKATNPPCAFTEYATCPLPPKNNILDIDIKAGEKLVDH